MKPTAPRSGYCPQMYFTSHIVQMKRSTYTQHSTVPSCFTSHIVQMKQYCSAVHGRCNSTLHPTLFRWNAQTAWLGWPGRLLYIPHCSDETRLIQKIQKVCFAFTSHIVQMKPLILWPAACTSFNFTSHIVQMKRARIFSAGTPLMALHPTLFRWNAQT